MITDRQHLMTTFSLLAESLEAIGCQLADVSVTDHGEYRAYTRACLAVPFTISLMECLPDFASFEWKDNTALEVRFVAEGWDLSFELEGESGHFAWTGDSLVNTTLKAQAAHVLDLALNDAPRATLSPAEMIRALKRYAAHFKIE